MKVKWNVNRFFIMMQCVKYKDSELCVETTQAIEKHGNGFGWVFFGYISSYLLLTLCSCHMNPLERPEFVSTEVVKAVSLI